MRRRPLNRLTGRGPGGRIGTQSLSLPSQASLLAEYDFLQGANSAVLYDKSGSGNNGTVYAGKTFTSLGLNGDSTAANAFAASGVAASAVKTLIVYFKPRAGGDLFATDSGASTLTPLYGDLSSPSVAYGDLGPRVRDLNTSAQVVARQNAASWPLSIGFTFGDPGKQYVNGVEASIYDAQSNGSAFSPGSDALSFANNFVSTGSSTHLYCYAALYSTALSAADMLAAHAYMAAKVNTRGVTIGGPVTLTADLLTLTGNSITNLIDLAEITPTITFDKLKIGFGGATPSQVHALADQATFPLRRPLATRNYAVIWPTPNTASVSDITDYILPMVAEMRSLGWKVSIVTAISGNGFDTIKNAINAYYDTLMGGASPPFDYLIDLRAYTQISADGAYSNLTYFLDGVHPTPLSYTNYIAPGITAGVNAMG